MSQYYLHVSIFCNANPILQGSGSVLHEGCWWVPTEGSEKKFPFIQNPLQGVSDFLVLLSWVDGWKPQVRVSKRELVGTIKRIRDEALARTFHPSLSKPHAGGVRLPAFLPWHELVIQSSFHSPLLMGSLDSWPQCFPQRWAFIPEAVSFRVRLAVLFTSSREGWSGVKLLSLRSYRLSASRDPRHAFRPVRSPSERWGNQPAGPGSPQPNKGKPLCMRRQGNDFLYQAFKAFIPTGVVARRGGLYIYEILALQVLFLMEETLQGNKEIRLNIVSYSPSASYNLAFLYCNVWRHSLLLEMRHNEHLVCNPNHNHRP